MRVHTSAGMCNFQFILTVAIFCVVQFVVCLYFEVSCGGGTVMCQPLIG